MKPPFVQAKSARNRKIALAVPEGIVTDFWEMD